MIIPFLNPNFCVFFPDYYYYLATIFVALGLGGLSTSLIIIVYDGPFMGKYPGALDSL